MPSPRVPFLSDTSNETADDAPHMREAPRPAPGLLLVWSVDAPQHRPSPIGGGTAPCEIGRSSAALIEFPNDPAMSRLHCDVQVEGDALIIRDRGGRNGTYLNGARIHGTVRTPLAERGVLRAGSCLVLIEPDLHRVGWQSGPFQPNLRSTLLEDGIVIGPAMARIRAEVADAARRGFTLFVQAETGAGKEIIASHYAAESGRPHIKRRNCANFRATSPRPGSSAPSAALYTGAHRDRAGAFEEAHRGVLFLDELAELPLEVQPKLLRVLEERTIRPVGGDEKPIDVALVCATHADLEKAGRQGRFRADLWYRLAQHPVTLPPLRERREELPYLVHLFLEEFEGEPPVSVRFMEACLRGPWRGNVREERRRERRDGERARGVPSRSNPRPRS
ncbi:MAG: sigma 54-interacting transcriptional regulator [Myxococcales bacterium]|nr:sigma 54-interacting transcriptional regulator [Myxococcales bacterium]